MRIGTDVSIQTCIAEGYLMMNYKKKELFTNGKINKEVDCQFITHLPDYVKEEMGWKVGDNSIDMNVSLNANDIWELYLDNKSGIDSFIGMEHIDIKSEYDLLHVASDVNSYMGLGIR